MGETRALLVLHDGKPVFERYGPGFDFDSRHISWSIAKSFTAVLAGFLVADGRLALDTPAPVAQWQKPGDSRATISLRHLLNMVSGLEHVELGNPIWESETTVMLFGDGAKDMAAYAKARPATAPPGEHFTYSTVTSVIVSDIVTNAVVAQRKPSERPLAEQTPAEQTPAEQTPAEQTHGASDDPQFRRDAMREFIAERLAEPLGMTSLTPEFDARGTMIGGAIMHATARDYAKFGEFLRNRGVVDDKRLLPESWIRFMLTPVSIDQGYGGHIWLNRARPEGVARALWSERGPDDLFACLGHQGQYIIVSPSQGLTIVRLGVTQGASLGRVRVALADLAAAF